MSDLFRADPLSKFCAKIILFFQFSKFFAKKNEYFFARFL